MKQVSNDELTVAINSEDLIKLKNSIFRKFVSIDSDEANSLYLIAAWKALGKFSPDRGVKFSTYFCAILYKECLSHLKSNQKHPKFKQVSLENIPENNYSIAEYLELVPKKYGDLLHDRFVLGLTLQELGKKYDRSYEVMRRRLKKAIKTLKLAIS